MSPVENPVSLQEHDADKGLHSVPLWRISLLVALFCFALGYLAGRQGVRQTDGRIESRGIQLKPGPWGELEYTKIQIQPPEEYLSVRYVEDIDRRWRFSGYTVDQVKALFEDAGLDAAQRVELLSTSKWREEAGAIVVTPSRELILSLSPDSRKRIYMALLRMEDNQLRALCYSFPAEHFDEKFPPGSLAASTVDMVRRLSFFYGKQLFFCDLPIVLDALDSHTEKVRLMKILLSQPTLLLRLRIMPDSDIEGISRYWAKGGSTKDVRPMLESLAKVPGGSKVTILTILPSFPSARLYSFPYPSLKPADLKKDCHWMAFNFFRDPPEDRFTDPQVVKQTLQNNYYPVLSDPRYGDLVMLAKPNGDIIHSAVFIADNIVYTKNSAHFRDPFLLMTIPDMLDRFAGQIPEDQSLQILTYRNKYY